MPSGILGSSGEPQYLMCYEEAEFLAFVVMPFFVDMTNSGASLVPNIRCGHT